jgi:transcriptional regulator with XRE-family HTH domain
VNKNSDVCTNFGEKVRKLRLSNDLSQEALADKANLHRTYIGGIERGERNPTLTTICRLAAALSVEPFELLKDNE